MRNSTIDSALIRTIPFPPIHSFYVSPNVWHQWESETSNFTVVEGAVATQLPLLRIPLSLTVDQEIEVDSGHIVQSA